MYKKIFLYIRFSCFSIFNASLHFEFFFVNLSLFYSGLNFDYTNTNFCDFSAIEHFLCFKIIPSLLFYAYISDRYIYQLNVFIMNSIKF